MGRRPADRVIVGGRLVNVHTREILDANVAIAAGRVACFGDVAHCTGPDTEVTDAAGAFLVPGLVDTHVHVESTLVTVRPFADAALRAGTTTVLIENHDMANVFGVAGTRCCSRYLPACRPCPDSRTQAPGSTRRTSRRCSTSQASAP
jgi:adenine deaminase